MGRGGWGSGLGCFRFCGHLRELQFLFSFVFKVLPMHVDIVVRDLPV